ncbi:unnamed protein product, partial [Eruca vesicaria subsp. sativa]|nr:unnamed protein product [Eruca vesicaria subsp. sativa]
MVEVGDIADIQEMQGNQNFADNQIRIRLTQVWCVAYGSVAEKLYQYLWRLRGVALDILTTVEGCSDILSDSQISLIKYYKS